MLHPRDIDLIRSAAHSDPFSVLGPHDDGQGGWTVGVFLPHAETVTPLGRATGGMLRLKLTRRHDDGLFEGLGAGTRPTDYPLRVRWSGGAESVIDNPYRFGRVLGEMAVWLLADGSCSRSSERTPARSAVCKVRPSRSGRRMHRALAWSVTSTAGKVAATRCGIKP